AASLSRRLVSPAIALTMTTTSLPAACVARARAATCLIRSTVPTEVPPNFWTMRATGARDLASTSAPVKRGSAGIKLARALLRRGPSAPDALRRGKNPAPGRRLCETFVRRRGRLVHRALALQDHAHPDVTPLVRADGPTIAPVERRERRPAHRPHGP